MKFQQMVLRAIHSFNDIFVMFIYRTINAGKSKRNEDQASVYVGSLTRTIKCSNKEKPQVVIPKSLESKDNQHVLNGIVENGTSSTNGDSTPNGDDVDFNASNPSENSPQFPSNPVLRNPSAKEVTIPYYYFGVFDGHAGWGAAVCAANLLHHVLHVSN